MRALRLRVKNTAGQWLGVGPVVLYTICEDSDGTLVWNYLGPDTVGDLEGTVTIPRCGHCSDTDVESGEAEALTGLFMPAAMDRLRELVHESEAG